MRGHVGQLVLDGLVFGDGFAKRGAALRVANGLFKRCAGNAQATGGDVQALGFQARHHLFETLTLAGRSYPNFNNIVSVIGDADLDSRR